MCGIAGVINLAEPPAGQDVSAIACIMKRALAHRGPDDEGLFVTEDRRLALAHRRLSILDLSPAGHQPMSDATGRYQIVFNGEIYNYQSLREELLREGCCFRSATDTEVILALYLRHGAASFARLRGMFAFALWDSPAGRLLLVRDPLGIKPMYYYATADKLLFASEVRALLATGEIPRRLSSRGLLSYLRCGSVQAPATVVDGILCQRPGHYLEITANKGRLELQEFCYAAAVPPPFASGMPHSRGEAVAELRDALRESVRIHLISDVPVGIFLSGGIDSSAIAALTSHLADQKPKAFTVAFREKEYSEEFYSALAAERFGLELVTVQLSEDQLLREVPNALRAMDQPTMDGINTYVISKAVKQAGVTVALSGLGGDEIFGGYASFQRARRAQKIRKVPRLFRTPCATLGRSVWGRSVGRRKFWDLLESDCAPRTVYAISRQLFGLGEIRALAGQPPPPGGALSLPFACPRPGELSNEVSECELTGYMNNTLLRDTDFMSMAHALEVRVPFVDQMIVQFVRALPEAWKNTGRHKALLVDALGDLCLKEIARRPKMGFTLPFGRWMHSALARVIDESFSDARQLARVGLRPAAVEQTWRCWRADARRESWTRPWALYVLTEWCRLHDIAN